VSRTAIAITALSVLGRDVRLVVAVALGGCIAIANALGVVHFARRTLSMQGHTSILLWVMAMPKYLVSLPIIYVMVRAGADVLGLGLGLASLWLGALFSALEAATTWRPWSRAALQKSIVKEF